MEKAEETQEGLYQSAEKTDYCSSDISGLSERQLGVLQQPSSVFQEQDTLFMPDVSVPIIMESEHKNFVRYEKN